MDHSTSVCTPLCGTAMYKYNTAHVIIYGYTYIKIIYAYIDTCTV